ncbi:peptidoglycan-binding protein [Candidatus Nomurabacteria bacterium]|nr:peptidoglycan-binding protein [Candidatus Nomurabacteria bacterium]
MTITNSSNRLAVIAASVAVAAGLIGAVAIAPAQAASLSSTQVQAIVNLLQSFGADSGTIANVTAALNGQATGGTSGGSTSGGACPALSRDLQQGSSGADVMALQAFLNGSADTMVAASGAGAPGMETSTFGPATKAAVIKFQVKYAISPAAGYVGPVTRAKIASVCGTTGGNTGGNTGGGALQGGEGSLDINGDLGDVETDVNEGEEDVQVLGAELEGQDSDIMLERVDVDVTLSGTGSSQLDNYITEVSLWLDGKRLATLDVDEGDEDSNDVFSFRFTGLKGVVQEDEQSELYVAVTAVNNVDTGDIAKNLVFSVPQNGIRAVDAEGISETYVSSSESTTLTSGSVNVTEETAGDLDITEGDENPDGQVVSVDEDNDTNDVLVLAFDLEADNQDVVVDDIPVGLTSTGLTGGIDVAVKRAILKKDGTTIKTKTISSTASDYQEVVFDDLDLDIEDGETAEFQVFVDLHDAEVGSFATGSTLYASTTGSDAQWDVEDAEGDDVTPGGSVNNSGDTLVFETEGIEVELVSVSEEVIFAGETSGQKQIGEFKIVVDITANGEDMYIDKSATLDTQRDGTGSAGNGFMYATTTDSTTGTSSAIAAVVTATGSTSGDSSNTFKINDGQTRRFTLTVTLEAGLDGVIGLQLFGINYDDADGASSAEFFTSNLSDFKTDLLTVLII